MVRWRALPSVARSGLLICGLLLLGAGGWALSLAWVAVASALGALGIAADAIGSDTRAPGDWTRADSP